MPPIVLKNDVMRMEFAPESGRLVALSSADGGWEILNRPELGLSFRLLVPLVGRRNNNVLGENQKLTFAEVAPDGGSAMFVWEGVSSEYGGSHDIKLTIDVGLTPRQATYTVSIENRSDCIIENVYCPYLGDVQRPPGAEWLRAFIYCYASADEWSLWPTYQSLKGDCQVDYPTQYATWSPGTPMAPFFLLRSADQGLYVGVVSPSEELVVWTTELRPGHSSSMDGRVPEGSAIGGKDISTRFAAVHVPYILPGESRTLTPIALEIFRGGWQSGVDIYKTWRSSWMNMASIPRWANEPHSWQQIHINSPEDELRIPYRDLVQIGEDCSRHGVRAIQLVGWNLGGQDQGNPSHDTEPRLGTSDDLKQAIAKIRALGVKVILFCKFTWADRATDRFRNDLVRLAVKDPYGDYYVYPGYQYQTATQLLDINTKRLVPMCFLSEEYLEVCKQEFRKVLELGVDGILYDECLHHSPALLCFDEKHGHRYGAPVYANDRKLIRCLDEVARQVNPKFMFAGEACYDWEFEVYQLSYHRSRSREHIPLSRYMQPDMPMMTAVSGFNDRNMVNQCLMYRYIISYEPYYFKGRLEDFPLTLEYGKQMDALRGELRGYFWDGEFRHECGARVTGESGAHHPYAVYLNRENQKAGIVIANYDDHASTRVHAELDGGGRLPRYRLVDDPKWRPTMDGIVIPCNSAAVLIEE